MEILENPNQLFCVDHHHGSIKILVAKTCQQFISVFDPIGSHVKNVYIQRFKIKKKKHTQIMLRDIKFARYMYVSEKERP